MARKKSVIPAIALAVAAISVAAAGIWAIQRYAYPTIDMSSIDAMDDSVARAGRLLPEPDRKRLDQLYRSRKSGLTFEIIKLRAAGGTGEFHGLSGSQFLAELEKEWKSKEGERAQRLAEAVQNVNKDCDDLIKLLEKEFDATARVSTPQEVEEARERMKRDVAEINLRRNQEIERMKKQSIQPDGTPKN